jgi:hypothetical protein
MSGGLARLVLRAQGRVPVAAPLLPSRFAPVPSVAAAADWTGLDTGDEGLPTTATQRTAPPPPARPDPPRSAEADREAPTARPHDAIPSRDPAAMEPERGAPGPTRDEPTISPTAPGGTQRTVPAEAVEPLPATVADALPPWSARAPDAAPPLPPRRQTEPPAVPPAPPLATRVAAPALEPRRLPDVHISIGRLEVHALPARATPARATPARAPRVTLADYLAQRK